MMGLAVVALGGAGVSAAECTFTQTAAGEQCRPWSEVRDWTDVRENYCAQPSIDPGDGPWCYKKGGGWGYCKVADPGEPAASTCCNAAIPKLPLTTTTIDSSVCSEGTLPILAMVVFSDIPVSPVPTLHALTHAGMVTGTR